MPCARREQRCSGCALGHVVETVGYPPPPPPIKQARLWHCSDGHCSDGRCRGGHRDTPGHGWGNAASLTGGYLERLGWLAGVSGGHIRTAGMRLRARQNSASFARVRFPPKVIHECRMYVRQCKAPHGGARALAIVVSVRR
jgi:hypothetical protein